MRTSHPVSILFAAVLAGLAPAGGAAPPATPDPRAADEAAVREADMAAAKLARTGPAGMLSLYVDDTLVMAPNAPIARDAATRAKMINDLYALPGFALHWQVDKVEVARAGDLAYSVGTYSMTMNDAQGQPAKDVGKYTSIWRKQADGSWKVVVDMFNSDLPVHAPTPPPTP